MNGKISVIIHTFNEEKNIERVINSIKWADEILVCDMHSEDNTPVIAKKLGAKVIFHKNTGFVEPARNFAISKASHEWILIVDSDEEIPESLASNLKNMIKKPIVSTYVEIPRKNIIFGKWMKASMWWPDYNVRFFKAGSASWSNKIHRPPQTLGQGIKLPADERYAIIHHNYSSVWEYLERLNRYTTIQAKELKENNMELGWEDLIKKPLSEFLGRFFANKGFMDGMHGLALAMLQAFSEFIVTLKLWEMQKFEEKDIKWEEVKEEIKKGGEEVNYWLKYGNLSKNPLKKLFQKVKNQL